MRKTIVYLDCDTCHRSFPRITNDASGSEPSQWRAIAKDLEYAAQLSGWHCYHDRHKCFDCVMEQMYPEEFVRA